MQSRGVTGIYINNIAQDGPLVNDFTYTPSVISALEAALSSERLTAYLQATGGHQERALRLYLWNTEISAAFYGPLQGLEIVLRNALHRELSRVHGVSWYDGPFSSALSSRTEPYQRRESGHYTGEKVRHSPARRGGIILRVLGSAVRTWAARGV
jgi:hypothetical protein